MGETLNALILSVLPMAVCAGFWVWKGATPGKMLTGLRVVRADTFEPLGWGRALGRYLAYNLSFLTCGLGFAWAGWDARKQSLHDRVAGTVVVRGEGGSTLKNALLGAAAAALILGACVYVAAEWMNANRDRLQAEGVAIKEDARTFGAAHTRLEAVQEALARVDACDGILCEARTRVFLKEALEASAPSEGLCAGAPPDGSIVAGALWANESCAKHGRATPPCGRLMQEVIAHCAASRAAN